MNREERQHQLHYKHAAYKIIKTRKTPQPNTRFINFVKTLYKNNLNGVIEDRVMAYSPFPQIANATRYAQKQQATEAAIVDELVSGKFEHKIQNTRLLQPAWCNISQLWKSKRPITLSLAFYEKHQQQEQDTQQPLPHTMKKVEKEKLNKQKKKASAQLKRTREQKTKKSTLNPKLLLMNVNNNNNNTDTTITSGKQKEIATESFEKLHQLWLDYLTSLGTIHADQFLKIDLHGAKCTIVKSSNPSWLNKSGIIIKETCNTFQIWNTSESRSITVPKKNNIFDISLDRENKKSLTIYGNNFMFRSAERASRKFTRNDTIDL